MGIKKYLSLAVASSIFAGSASSTEPPETDTDQQVLYSNDTSSNLLQGTSVICPTVCNDSVPTALSIGMDSARVNAQNAIVACDEGSLFYVPISDNTCQDITTINGIQDVEGGSDKFSNPDFTMVFDGNKRLHLINKNTGEPLTFGKGEQGITFKANIKDAAGVEINGKRYIIVPNEGYMYFLSETDDGWKFVEFNASQFLPSNLQNEIDPDGSGSESPDWDLASSRSINISSVEGDRITVLVGCGKYPVEITFTKISSNPTISTTIWVGETTTNDPIMDVVVDENGNQWVLDRNLTNLQSQSTVSIGNDPKQMQLVSGFMYIRKGTDELVMVDVSNPQPLSEQTVQTVQSNVRTFRVEMLSTPTEVTPPPPDDPSPTPPETSAPGDDDGTNGDDDSTSAGDDDDGTNTGDDDSTNDGGDDDGTSNVTPTEAPESTLPPTADGYMEDKEADEAATINDSDHIDIANEGEGKYSVKVSEGSTGTETANIKLDPKKYISITLGNNTIVIGGGSGDTGIAMGAEFPKLSANSEPQKNVTVTAGGEGAVIYKDGVLVEGSEVTVTVPVIKGAENPGGNNTPPPDDASACGANISGSTRVPFGSKSIWLLPALALGGIFRRKQRKETQQNQ